jgi:hypothetical protein
VHACGSTPRRSESAFCAHGYRVLRISWRQIVDIPEQTLRRIHAALRDP